MNTIRILRIIRWITLGLGVVIAVGIAFLEFGPAVGLRPQAHSVADSAPGGMVAVPDGVPIGGPFNLIDDKGRTITQANYQGHWMLVFFGYTNCPDECPLTLQKIATAMGALGPLADRITPLLITVDPARDTPEKLSEYLANFDIRIVGLTGTSEQIAAVAKVYRVYYSSGEHERSGVDLVSHSNFLYLMNPAGKLDALFVQHINADQLIAALRTRLAAQEKMASPN